MAKGKGKDKNSNQESGDGNQTEESEVLSNLKDSKKDLKPSLLSELKNVPSSASLSEKLPGDEEPNLENDNTKHTEIQQFKDEIKAGVSTITSFWDDFKDYLEDEDIFNSSVTIVTGQAFTEITNSFVKDIIVPLVSTLIGRPDATKYFLVLKGGRNFRAKYRTAKQAIDDGAHIFHYGKFIQKIINFVFLGLTLIGFVRLFRSILFYRKRKLKASEASKKDCPYCFSSVDQRATRCPFCTASIPNKAVGHMASPLSKPQIQTGDFEETKI